MSAAVAAAAAPHADVKHRGLITLCVMGASIMQALDTTIANVALPHIQGSLSSTQEQMSWVLTSYIVATAIMTPLSGWLAGQVGRRRIFLFSVIGFTIASAMCGISQSLPEIVIARTLQGICGAALIPLSQAVMLDINPPERHGRAMSLWVMGVTVGPIIGPALGGWLTEYYSWRWVFFINLPVGILCWLGISAFMPETKPRKSRFDFFGFAALSLAIGALQLMLDRGQIKDWFSSTEIWIEGGIGAVAAYLFIVHLATTKHPPFVSPALFKDRNFLTGNFFIFVVGMVLFATLALLPPLLQTLLGYPVVYTGLVTAPRGLGTLASMIILGKLMGRVDTRMLIAFGFMLTAVSLWMMTHFYLQMPSDMIIWSGVLQGLGTGFVFVPLSAITFATLAPHLRNEGAAVFSLMRNIGSSVGISAVVALLTRNTQILHSRLAEHVTPFGDGLSAGTAALSSSAGLAAVNGEVTRQASMLAYNNDFYLMLVLTVLAVPLVALLRPAARAKIDPAAAVE
ncbi:MAG TPA: DHA2 family efflux MFS transporter permease subunit [Steroidobacteraceae bacterium]|jgi:DHA2 family multidrug resistance protein|nr:DHA2 family efflux MFS transporter permease subunit [Steroidobacteraceae bacterium]